MKFLLFLIPILFIASCVPLLTRGKSKTLSILFIGNSYSFGVPSALEKLAASRGKIIRTGHSTNGGWTLAQHAAHLPTLRKIRSRKWDIVVLQDHSLNPGDPRQLQTSTIPALRTLVAEIRATGAEPVLYQTWGRRDSFAEMNPKVRDGYHKAAAELGNLRIVPAGDYWARHFSPSLYHEDGSHPSAEGDALTAKAFYDTLIR